MTEVGGMTGAIVCVDDDLFDPELVATLCKVWYVWLHRNSIETLTKESVWPIQWMQLASSNG
jgi:hypothetical protein